MPFIRITTNKSLSFKDKTDLKSGIDSSVKPYCIQGIHMYRQYIWIKGKYMVDRLKKTDLI